MSVVTNGLPVPPARMTMRPFLQVPAGPAADVRLGHAVGADGRHQPRVAAQRLQGVLQGQAVDHRGQHAHVVGRGLVDAGIAGGELRAAEDVAAADDDGDLHPVLGGVVAFAGRCAARRPWRCPARPDARNPRRKSSAPRGDTWERPPVAHLLGHRRPYSLGNSQWTKRTSFMPASLATWPTVFLSYFISLANGCSARQHSA